MENGWEIPYNSISNVVGLREGDNSLLYTGTLSGRTIAVKYVDAYEATKEIELLSRLKHENIVELCGVCTQPPNICILMEYCEKGSLHDIIHSDYRIGKNQFFDWAKQIAEGMRYLHEHNIIHRNLKPANILVTDSYKLKISGFGSSRFLEKEESASMKLCGSAAYMAPEIIMSEPYSNKVDIWSFGVVLWEMFTRDVPFKDLNLYAIIFNVAQGKLKPSIPPAASSNIKQWLNQCLNYDPSNRPSFKSLLDDILSFEHGSVFDEEADLVGEEILRRQKIEASAFEGSCISSFNQSRSRKRSSGAFSGKKIKRLVPSKNADLSVESVPQKWIVPYKSIEDPLFIGSGAQGKVFKGDLNGKIIAVKMVQSKEDTEIGHLLRLKHKNLIKFYGICNEAPQYCVLMEYCEFSLHERIHNEHEIGSRYFIEWAPQIASGMCYLHEHKIVHRDLKPAKVNEYNAWINPGASSLVWDRIMWKMNTARSLYQVKSILVSDSDTLKITDFGDSRILERQKSAPKSLHGTAAYIAPEIIQGEPYSEKVDIWSFGVVLWEMLTGEVPFKDLNLYAIIFNVAQGKLKPPIPPAAPSNIKQLINQCLNYDPRKRPSFKSLLNDILSFEHGVRDLMKKMLLHSHATKRGRSGHAKK